MSISEKQLTANHANAQKSTGSRTFEGCRGTSQNALKHGVLAKAILIECECEEGFLQLCKAYVREYQTPTEHALVNKAVTAQWRVLRAASLESAAITHELHRQSKSTAHEGDTTRAMLAVRALNETSTHMERPSLYEYRKRAGRSCPLRAFGKARRPRVSVARVETKDLQHRHAIRDLQRPWREKMNLNKPTHFDEATKQLIAPTPVSKPIFDPSKAA